ncbi:MAG: 4-carboxymuconolactone decarboxylase [Pelagibacterales bacterium]|jgi:4-carboxymuconolactone decarboxylase|nr:4-carboxymuconolactone decarboxylase [Pelagibacterales bacterium]MCH2678179.1 carboxymuconolactone decarboxylase family protein [Alphaproteobacteria bacterium]|tara:strand:- start:238 stop:645 length:408 start_codon:yes stop_codon:yes gene_type:complete
MKDDLYEKGLEARKNVLSNEYVNKSIEGADSFNAEFQEFITKYCWGEIWTKTILSNKQRSMNNLCMLSALNKWQEFSIHFRGAIKNGCTLLELKDVLLQITVYCGVPCGVEAFRHARKVLEEDGIDIEKEFSKND